MKKLLIAIASFMLSSLAMAGQSSLAFTGTIKILPTDAQYISGTYSRWATNTAYAQGSYVENSFGKPYMAIQGGTSSVLTALMPSHGDGIPQGTNIDGTVIWYALLGSPRNAFIIQNISGTNITLCLGRTNAINKGILLTPGATYSDGKCWHGEVYGTSGSVTGATFTATEY